MLKEYVVCEEKINDRYFYTIRTNTDCCNPLRFKICNDFDTYEEANEYINYLLYPEKYFNKDD